MKSKFRMRTFLRTLGWLGEDRTPQEIATQVKGLNSSTLIFWSELDQGWPNTPLAFQMGLVKLEMQKRGIHIRK
tara:strand:+ start:732 stop:953 length:222 start_codon:yes stop_codon:yes gene_type:complete